MSFASLLLHTIVVFNPAVGATDRYGDEVPTFDAGTSEPARVQQVDTNEILLNRDTRITKFLVFGPATSVITSLSEVEWSGRRFRVEGQPWKVDDAAGVHHVETTLEEILG